MNDSERPLKIVLTNDDGVDAPGLATLASIVSKTAQAVVVAPEQPQSGVGHRVTTHEPLRVRRLGRHRYGVDGTPVDCVRLALKTLVPDAHWLIAGINPGANLGTDVYQSGTVAAAREAAILGCRAIALSQYISANGRLDWDVTGRHAARMIAMLLNEGLPAGHYFNVNLPHPLGRDDRPQHRFCRLDRNPHRYTFRRDGDEYLYEGVIHERPREPDRDVDVCFSGGVAVSRLCI